MPSPILPPPHAYLNWGVGMCATQWLETKSAVCAYTQTIVTGQKWSKISTQFEGLKLDH